MTKDFYDLGVIVILTVAMVLFYGFIIWQCWLAYKRMNRNEV